VARRAGNHELTREMIMEAARTLFVQQGYKNVSMRKIAQVLQYSHGALYYHFKNKAELFYAIVEQDFQQLDQLLDDIMQLDLLAEEKMKQVLLGYIRFGLNHQNQYEIMFLLKDGDIQRYLHEKPLQSYDKFAQVMHQLSGKRLGIHQTWSIFFALHGFVTHYSRFGLSYEQAKEAAELHVQTILDWLPIEGTNE
jgi:AcrR family transcriptional regulator